MCLHTRLTEFLLHNVTCSVLLFISQRLNSLMNAHEGEYLCFREVFININKLLIGSLVSVYFFHPFYYIPLCCYLFTSQSFFFILMLLLIRYCLFVDHISKSINFVYHFKNTISILV